MKKQYGFSVIELLLVCSIVVVTTLLGVYAWRQSRAQPTPYSASTNTQPPHKGFLTYRSTHSSLHFEYPASWQLISSTPSVSSNDPLLEKVTVKGHNNFVMQLLLYKDHVQTGASCALSYYGPTVKLSDTYTIASTLDTTDKTAIDSLSLIPASDAPTQGSSGCGLDFLLNAVGSTMEFSFGARYTKESDISATASKSATTYFELPEVQAAEAVFESVQQ